MSIDARNIYIYSPMDLTTATGSSTGAAVPLASVAAGGASVRNVCKRVQVSVCTSSASVQVPVTIQLFDGASSTGTVLASWQLTPQVSTFIALGKAQFSGLFYIDADDLHIKGAVNTAMALSGPVGGAAGTLIGLNLQTYLFPKANTVAFANPS